MVWVLLAASALGAVVFVERRLTYHRVQINTTALLGGLKNVLRQKNLVEAIDIGDATPSPAARLVKTVLTQHNRPREEEKAAWTQYCDRKALINKNSAAKLRAKLKDIDAKTRSPDLPSVLPDGLTLRCLVPWAAPQRQPTLCL